MATLDHHLRHAAEIKRLSSVVRLTRDDVGPISEGRRQWSLRQTPPPTSDLSDEQMRALVEPQAIRWPKDLIPNYRETPVVNETIPYFRYSTDMQEYSIDYQRAAVADWYDLRSNLFQLPPLTTKVFADPETSGGKRLFERRWGGQLGHYFRPGDHLVFAYFDRMGRSAVDTLQCLDAFVRVGVFVHILDHAEFQFCDPRHPNTIKRIQDAAIAAEHERRMTADRTRRTYRTNMAEGKALGGAAGIGYRKVPNPAYVPGVVDGRKNPRFLVEFSPFEAAVCEEIYRLWLLEGWSAYEIVKALRNRAKRDPRFLRFDTGRPWHRYRVKYLLKKMHAERSTGGAAGMFQTPALRGIMGAN